MRSQRLTISRTVIAVLVLVLLQPFNFLAHATFSFSELTLPSLGSDSATIASVAQSRDGKSILLGTLDGNLLFSQDSGTSWLAQTSTCADSCTSAPSSTGKWGAVAISPDGKRIMAGDKTPTTGDLWTAIVTDTRTIWSDRSSAGQKKWSSVVISDDGTRMAAAGTTEGTNYQVYYSGDSGTAWGVRASSHILKKFVASNDLRLISGYTAIDETPLPTSFSDDWGSTWQESIYYQSHSFKTASAASRFNVLAAIESHTVFTSTSSGLNWDSVDSIAGTHTWIDVSVSGDGSHIAVVDSNRYVYLSKDSGATWESVQIASGTPTAISISQDASAVLVSTENKLWRATFTDSPNLSIEATPQTGVIGHAISPIVPQNKGTASTFSVSPPLPAGLVLDTYLGSVTGKPTVTLTQTEFTITATSLIDATTSTATFVLGVISDYTPVSELVHLYGTIKNTSGTAIGNATIEFSPTQMADSVITYSDSSGNYDLLVTPGPGKIRFISYSPDASTVDAWNDDNIYRKSNHSPDVPMPRYLSLSGDITVPAGMSGLHQDLTIPTYHSVSIHLDKAGTPVTALSDKTLLLVGAHNCNVSIVPGATQCEWGDPFHTPPASGYKSDASGNLSFVTLNYNDIATSATDPFFITTATSGHTGEPSGWLSINADFTSETITATADAKPYSSTIDTGTIETVLISGTASPGKKITWCPSLNYVASFNLGFLGNSCNENSTNWAETITTTVAGDGAYSIRTSTGHVCLKIETGNDYISSVGCLDIAKGTVAQTINLNAHGLTMKTIDLKDAAGSVLSGVYLNSPRTLSGVSKKVQTTYDSDLITGFTFQSQKVNCTGLITGAIYNDCSWSPYKYSGNANVSSLSVPVLTSGTQIINPYSSSDTKYHFIASANTTADLVTPASTSSAFKGKQVIIDIDPVAVPDTITVSLPDLKNLYGVLKDKSGAALANVTLYYTPDGAYYYGSPYYGTEETGNRLRVVSDESGKFTIPNMGSVPGLIEIYTALQSPEVLIPPVHGQTPTKPTIALPNSMQVVAQVDLRNSTLGAPFEVSLPISRKVKIHAESFTLGLPEVGASVSLSKSSLSCKKTINTTFEYCSIAPVGTEWQRTDSNGNLTVQTFDSTDMNDSFTVTVFDRANRSRIASNVTSTVTANQTISVILPDAPLAPEKLENIPLAAVISLPVEVDPAPTPSPVPSASSTPDATTIDTSTEVVQIDATSPSDLPVTEAESVPANEETIAVAWDPPVSNGGATITDYAITIEDVTVAPETFIRASGSKNRRSIFTRKPISITIRVPLSSFSSPVPLVSKFRVSDAAFKYLRRSSKKQRHLVAEIKFVKNHIYRVSVAAINMVGTGTASKVKIDLKTASPAPTTSASASTSSAPIITAPAPIAISTSATPSSTHSETASVVVATPMPATPTSSVAPKVFEVLPTPTPMVTQVVISTPAPSPKPTSAIPSIKVTAPVSKLSAAGISVVTTTSAKQTTLTNSSSQLTSSTTKPLQVVLPAISKGTKVSATVVIGGKTIDLGTVTASKTGPVSVPPLKFTKPGTYKVVVTIGKVKKTLTVLVKS